MPIPEARPRIGPIEPSDKPHGPASAGRRASVRASFGQTETDPELSKGAVDCPPCEKDGDFPACWNERAMAIGGICRWLLVVFGSTRPKKNPKKIRRVWAGFSVGDITLDFRFLGKALCWGAATKGGVVSCSTSNKDPKSTHVFCCCCTPTSPRTAALKFDHCFSSSGSVRQSDRSCTPPLPPGPLSVCFCRHPCRRLVLAKLVLYISGCGLALVWFWATGVFVYDKP